MNWAIGRSRQLAIGTIGLSVSLVLANLLLGPDPMATRVATVLSLALVVPFLYFGMRWTLKVQIWQHGLSSTVVQSATFFFYFFGVGAVLALVIIVGGLGERTPFAVMFVGPAVFSYSAMDTIRRARADGATGEVNDRGHR